MLTSWYKCNPLKLIVAHDIRTLCRSAHVPITLRACLSNDPVARKAPKGMQWGRSDGTMLTDCAGVVMDRSSSAMRVRFSPRLIRRHVARDPAINILVNHGQPRARLGDQIPAAGGQAVANRPAVVAAHHAVEAAANISTSTNRSQQLKAALLLTPTLRIKTEVSLSDCGEREPPHLPGTGPQRE